MATYLLADFLILFAICHLPFAMSDISENIEYNLDTIQYTIPNYGFSDPYELAQYVNRIIAVGLCILVHLNVIIRLLFCNKNRVTSDYQILIIIQSAINLIACVSELVLNEIQTLNIRYLKIGHPFWQFTPTERLIYTLIMAVSSNSTQDFLMLFNLHRLIMIRRRSNLLTLYMIALPLMVIGSCMDAIESYPLILQSQDVNLFFKYSQLPIISVVIFFCYWKLRKEFRTNTSYSEKTKKLQEKLSWSILLQVIMLIIIAIVIAVIPSILMLTLPHVTFQSTIVYYTISAVLLCEWYSPLSAGLIGWSIIGFFKNHSASNVVHHSDGSMRKVSRPV